uniref:Uncharacterized protein n=1 Tax=viral metagenome TaxID=1070528 RepID=A0A6C0J2M7_9ZZZZ
MNDSQVLTYVTIAALIGFGIYRKNYTPTSASESLSRDGEAYALSVPPTRSPPDASDLLTTKPKSSYLTGKQHVAKIAYQLEQSLDPSESIIQVHDYSNSPGGDGIQHTFDVTTFNSSSTQSLTKRIQCLEKGNSVEILSEQIMSPITGSIMTQTHVMDDVSDLLIDNMESEGDVKFVRDKYAFVKKEVLPQEPTPLSSECTRQLNEDTITDACKTQLNLYSRSMAEYKRQVNESRENATFTRRRIGFAPMNDKIEDSQKYPFSQPQTFGFVAHEQAPIDYSSISTLKPLKDENFFNSLALENSSLAIQYG